MPRHILVIDQGTTSTRSLVFDAMAGGPPTPIATAQQEFPQLYPQPGWVEHDPEAIWASVLATARQALQRAGLQASEVAALGITNQRETTIVWDRRTGRPIHNAIVWQDRRTSQRCTTLAAAGHEPLVARRTGLRLDPYFAATKIGWLLDHVPGARVDAEAGHLAFGTVDSFLLWRLTGGQTHATDATNASRTLLFDIHRGAWDDQLLALFDIPRAMLPAVQDSAAAFGTVAPDLLGAPIPICGIAGDQQAALIGQACFQPGLVKSTYGTGCFVLLNTGTRAVPSQHRLITTIAYQLAGTRTYALEGSIFVAGAAVQWLRDGLGLIATAAETGALAAAADPAQPVYLVPAFVGLGAPHWDSDARALLAGITRGTTRNEIARAALECVAYQTRDLLAAMQADLEHHPIGSLRRSDDARSYNDPESSSDPLRSEKALADAGLEGLGTVIRVDGGMTASDWTMQFLADMLAAPVDRPACLETTSVGAAYLAGLQAGLYPDPATFATSWRAERRFEPSMPEPTRAAKYQGWRDALARALLQP